MGDLAISDHFPVEAEIELNYELITCKPSFRRNFKKINYKALNSDLSKISMHNAQSSDPNSLLSYWIHELESILDVYAPLRAYPANKKKNLQLPPEILAMINHRNKLVKQVKLSPSNLILLYDLRIMQKKVKSNITRYLKVKGEQTLSNSDRREAWKFIKKATNTTKSNLAPQASVEVLNDYFGKIVKTDNPESIITSITSCSIEDDFHLQDISVQTILKHLLKLKDNTATGNDGLPSSFLKKTAAVTAPNISVILNSCIKFGQFPDVWKKANIAAIYKGKGSKKDAANYRPISVLPCLARIFEKEISSQLSSYCLQRDVIPKEQFGFRPRSSCETTLLTALNSWIGDIDRLGMMVGVLLIDLSKAFDNVNHSILIRDLEEIGCSPSTLAFFTNYLTGRLQRVVNGEHISNWQSITKGVPQGSCISPILFNIYMRNLPLCVKDPVYQFADDITNSSTADNLQEIRSKLTENFQCIKSFCQDRDLRINTDKTQCILLKLPTKKTEIDLELCLDNVNIGSSKSVELLGFTIDQHLSFKPHIDKTIKKCHGIMGVIKKARGVLNIQLLKLCYTALVRPHLEYCSLVFANASKTNLAKLETFQKIASRIICDEPRDAHSDPLLMRLGLQSLGERREKKILKEVKKIINNDCHPSLANMFSIRSDGLIYNNVQSRTSFSNKRFSVYAAKVFNHIYDTSE